MTSKNGDAIPHGLKGYGTPYKCKCAVCRKAWAAYCKEKRDERKARGGTATYDEIAKKRAERRSTARASTKKSESSDSVGAMERAVITECEALTDPVNATQLVAAKQLASLIDKLSANEDGVGAAVINSSTKQLMSIMAEIRGDTSKSKATGRRKSGGRLATVGALTKVKRQGA
jgi:hypothetical protein